jgi:hypothetical protein
MEKRMASARPIVGLVPERPRGELTSDPTSQCETSRTGTGSRPRSHACQHRIARHWENAALVEYGRRIAEHSTKRQQINYQSVGDAAEIAEVSLYLMRFSCWRGYSTGQVLGMDGGAVAALLSSV